MDAHQLGVAEGLPQSPVEHGLFDVHVLQILGHEQRQRQVQVLERRRARGRLQTLQAVGHGAEPRDLLQMPEVFAGHTIHHAGVTRFDGRVHEAVLVAHVRDTQVQQRAHALLGGGHLLCVGRVGPAHGQQGVCHEGAQGFVDAGVEIDAARSGLDGLGGGGDLRQFVGVRLHGIPFAGLARLLRGWRRCTVHHLPWKAV